MRGGGFAGNIGIEKTGIPVVRDSRGIPAFCYNTGEGHDACGDDGKY